MAIETTVTSSPYYEITSGLPNADGPITVMIWGKQAGGGTGCFVSLSSVASISWSIISSTNLLDFNDGANHIGSAVISDSTWHSSAFTCAATTQTTSTYCDGVVDLNGSITKATGRGNTDLRIGIARQGYGLSAPTDFYGLKIWNAELTAGQIATEATSYSPVLVTGLYGSWLLTTAGATIADDSGNGHTLTQVTANWTTVSDPPPLGGGAATPNTMRNVYTRIAVAGSRL